MKEKMREGEGFMPKNGEAKECRAERRGRWRGMES